MIISILINQMMKSEKLSDECSEYNRTSSNEPPQEKITQVKCKNLKYALE